MFSLLPLGIFMPLTSVITKSKNRWRAEHGKHILADDHENQVLWLIHQDYHHLSIMLSQMRVEWPLPSMKRWHTLISTYFSVICSKVFGHLLHGSESRFKIQRVGKAEASLSYILITNYTGKWVQTLKQILRICWIPAVVPTGILSISPDSNRRWALSNGFSPISFVVIN